MAKEIDLTVEGVNWKEEIEKALNSIGWKLIYIGQDYWRFVNHHGTHQPFVYHLDRIQTDAEWDLEIYFSLKSTVIDLYDGCKAIGFRGKTDNNIFLNIYGSSEEERLKDVKQFWCNYY